MKDRGALLGDQVQSRQTFMAHLHDYPVAILQQHDVYELCSEERRERACKHCQQPLAHIQHAWDAVLLEVACKAWMVAR
jgi:hypothetical protein